MNSVVRALVLLGAALALAGCATHRPEPVPVGSADSAGLAASPWAAASSNATKPPAPWQHQEFPGKRQSHYNYVRLDGREAIAAHASSSASMLRQTVRVEPAELNHLRFSWKVPALIASADLAVRERADSPVRVVLAFEGDRSRFSPKDAMLSELAHALTGEPMPYATLMYVWCNKREPGTVLVNARTSRIRKLVMESGSRNLSQWMDYERDIRADFTEAFGEPPGALVSIGIMTDTDNTQSTTQAWYGPVVHVQRPALPVAVQTQ